MLTVACFLLRFSRVLHLSQACAGDAFSQLGFMLLQFVGGVFLLNGTERTPKPARQDEKGAEEVGVLLGLKVRRLQGCWAPAAGPLIWPRR